MLYKICSKVSLFADFSLQSMNTKKNLHSFLLSVLLLVLSFNDNICYGADTITANQSLSGDQFLLSAGENFKFGFYSPGNTSNYYIAMWYNKVSLQTIAWVANREIPISDRFSSELKIVDGNLVLLNESKVVVWSTNLNSSSSNSTQAVLQDDGNLVLKDGTQVLWQSFDHAVHTWLPGAKIGFNKITHKSQLLTSWKNQQDPSLGLFSLELDPIGSQYIILWNGSERYWSSGSWDPTQRIFSQVPEMRLNYIYNFSYVSNDNESYFTYSLYDSSIISRFIMDVSGQVKQLTWLESTKQWNLFWFMPRTQCEVYAFCGMFGVCSDLSTTSCTCLTGFESKSTSDWSLSDYSEGCVRKNSLSCGNNSSNANSRSDKFLESSNMRLPENEQSPSVGSIEACKTACLNNCSCTAYAYDGDKCSIWIGGLLNLQQYSNGDASAKTIYIRLAASEFHNSKSNTGMIAGIVGGCVAVIVVLLVLCLVLFLRRRKAVRIAKSVDGTLVPFGFRDLQNVTKNFSDKLGGGGFGSVFKGTLPDSSVIAVKKLEGLSQGEKQFRTEVSTIGTIQHVNLVRLRGFCSEGANKLLVYDYMPNGSLDTHLFYDKNVLDWKTRYQIGLGIARGLYYLHEKCRDCIIHCDIKPENILLDDNFCPKVADFGLAKLVGREFSRVLTTMRGTRGYLAPEWISGVAITPKADVYSYGMMMFELISGRRNFEQSSDGKIKFFPTYAAHMLIDSDGEDILAILDHKLEGNSDVQELVKICKVACWCVQDEESHRPSMGQIVQILEGVLDLSLPPIPRALQILVDSQENIIFFTESSSNGTSQTHTNSSAASSRIKSVSSSTSSNSELTQTHEKVKEGRV